MNCFLNMTEQTLQSAHWTLSLNSFNFNLKWLGAYSKASHRQQPIMQAPSMLFHLMLWHIFALSTEEAEQTRNSGALTAELSNRGWMELGTVETSHHLHKCLNTVCITWKHLRHTGSLCLPCQFQHTMWGGYSLCQLCYCSVISN